MKSVKYFLMICFSLLVLNSGSAAAEERAKAQVQCEKTDIRFVYDCLIVLMGKKSGKPIQGAKFEIGAEMPSMPMAHNVKPVMALPGAKPGIYHVLIQLQMYGEWVLKLDLKEPMRDLLIHKMHFGEEGTGGSDHKK